jgi:hypothetical protein
MKVCSKCNIEQELGEFYKRLKSPDGLQCVCKTCLKEYQEDNKDHIKEYQANYNAENNEKLKQYKVEYRRAGRDKR